MTAPTHRGTHSLLTPTGVRKSTGCNNMGVQPPSFTASQGPAGLVGKPLGQLMQAQIRERYCFESKMLPAST